MNKGLSLHIGVNAVDRHSFGEAHYRALRCCKRDAAAMRGIAVRNGFDAADPLIDRAATFDAVESGIRDAAGRLAAGDTFLLTYSGHGAQLLRGDAATDEGYDEGLVLSDGIMKDDYINTLLRLFPEKSCVIFVCDACHSRTMFEYARSKRGRRRIPLPTPQNPSDAAPRYKLLDHRAADDHRALLRTQYIERDRRFAEERREYLAATVVVLAACDDNQIAIEAAEYGLFTETLLNVLARDAGRAGFSYKGLIESIKAITAPSQTPSFVPQGPDPDSHFFQDPPFTIFRMSS